MHPATNVYVTGACDKAWFGWACDKDMQEMRKAFFADQPSVRTNFISTLGHGDRSTLHERLPRPAFEKFNRLV